MNNTTATTAMSDAATTLWPWKDLVEDAAFQICTAAGGSGCAALAAGAAVIVGAAVALGVVMWKKSMRKREAISSLRKARAST